MEASQKSAYISLRCGVRESFQKEVDDSRLQVFPPAVPTYGTQHPSPGETQASVIAENLTQCLQTGVQLIMWGKW